MFAGMGRRAPKHRSLTSQTLDILLRAQEKEEYLAAILNCVDSFFNGRRARIRFAVEVKGPRASQSLKSVQRSCRDFHSGSACVP